MKYLQTLLLALLLAFALAEGSTSTEEPSATYNDAQALVEVEDYQGAIDILLPMSEAEPENPDIFNLLGYSHRKLEMYEEALAYYTTALELDPMHLGANEYLGELYLETHEPELAAERVEVLKEACPDGCEELEELEAAVAAYQPE
ncbi:MAG: tetratricopeptide repeat protein [Trueperaceae bacterium]